MMEDIIKTYSLVFPEFAIDFDVMKQSSVELTRRYDSRVADFVFAVAETWLRTKSSRHLISPATHPGNLIEELKYFSGRIDNPISVTDLESLIPCGGWCAWMRGYWSRLNNDCTTANDERIYELLIPLSIMESREGHIAVYKYNSRPTIEIATRAEEHNKFISVFTNFDSAKMAREVREMQHSIAGEILHALAVG